MEKKYIKKKFICAQIISKNHLKTKILLKCQKTKMKQIINDYSYIFIKIRPLATFSRKVEKKCFKIAQWDTHWKCEKMAF